MDGKTIGCIVCVVILIICLLLLLGNYFFGNRGEIYTEEVITAENSPIMQSIQEFRQNLVNNMIYECQTVWQVDSDKTQIICENTDWDHNSIKIIFGNRILRAECSWKKKKVIITTSYFSEYYKVDKRKKYKLREGVIDFVKVENQLLDLEDLILKNIYETAEQRFQDCLAAAKMVSMDENIDDKEALNIFFDGLLDISFNFKNLKKSTNTLIKLYSFVLRHYEKELMEYASKNAKNPEQIDEQEEDE